MEIISSSTAQTTLKLLKQGVTMNKTIDRFFTLMGHALNASLYHDMGVSAVVATDSYPIEIKTPHAKVVAIAEHVMNDGDIAARITFSTLQSAADGVKVATEIMTVSFLAHGYITAVNAIAVTEQFGQDGDNDETVKEIALILLNSVQDHLPGNGVNFFSI